MLISDFGFRIAKLRLTRKRINWIWIAFRSETYLKSAIRNCKSAILVITLLLAFCVSAEAQQSARVPRIGFLSALSASSMSTRMEAFRNGLHELGYLEGK